MKNNKRKLERGKDVTHALYPIDIKDSMKKVKEYYGKGIIFKEKKNYDTVVLAESEGDLKVIINGMSVDLDEEYNMRFNREKTKVMERIMEHKEGCSIRKGYFKESYYN